MSDGNNCVRLNACDVSSISAATCELTMNAFSAVPTSKQYRGSISCKFHYWPSSASGHTTLQNRYSRFWRLNIWRVKGGWWCEWSVKREREGRARPLLRLDRILAGSYNLIDTLKKFMVKTLLLTWEWRIRRDQKESFRWKSVVLGGGGGWEEKENVRFLK